MKVWLIGLVLFVAACSNTELQPLKSGDVIVAFGDSLTAGKGVSEAQAYPAVLSELTGYSVVNAGISGETTQEGLSRLPEVLDRENPTLLILFEGGNDILRNYDLSETKQNLDAMITMAKNQGVQVALVGVPRKQLFSRTASFYSELAQAHKLPLEDDIVASLLRKPAMKSDNVHFNESGYRALAVAIAQMLKDAGLLERD